MPRSISDFRDTHKGETCLLVGNGLNLHLTPPTAFDLPSIGMNTIHKYDGWKPDYYAAADSRVMREFGAEIAETYRGVPKFIPTPNLDKWQGENFYRFPHQPGPLWPASGMDMTADFTGGITYGNVMHIAMQLAVFMGFTTLLIVGMEHKEAKAQDHFWGCDHGMSAYPPIDAWMAGYKAVADAFPSVKTLNISVNTCVPETIIRRGDWRDYAKG